MAEQTFFNDRGIYVSNTRVVIHGTTYSTANITSVREGITPAATGCATVLIVVGVLGVLLGFAAGVADAAAAVPPLVVSGILLTIGIVWYRFVQPVYHVVIASAAGERQGLSSPDRALVNQVTGAIANAITYRG